VELVKYEAARKALIEANSIDEVKDIKDKFEAIRAYAKQSKDTAMANWASEIRIRAERRMGEMLKEQEMQTGGDARKIATRSHGATEQIPPTLAEVGITKSMSSRAQKIASVPKDEFEEVVRSHIEAEKELTSATIQKLVKDSAAVEREQRREIPEDLPTKSDRFEIIHSNFQDAEIESNSVDAIITDPPYPKEYLYLYGLLADFASRVLKPGGLMVVMCGQSYLPQIYNDMSNHMDYLWTCAYMTPGQSLQVFTRKVNVFWKPLLLFSNGEYTGEWYGDVCKSEANDKNHHHWGQSESGMRDIIERFSLPMEVILDPFCGGGTTGVVALDLGRKFIGIDCDIDSINTTKARINA